MRSDREPRRELVHLHRVVDHELDRDQRVDAARVAALLVHRIAHRGEIDDAGHAREVLEQHAGGRERDLARRLVGRDPAGDRLDLRLGAVAEDVLEQDPQRVGQPRDVPARLERVEPVDRVARVADSELLRLGHASIQAELPPLAALPGRASLPGMRMALALAAVAVAPAATPDVSHLVLQPTQVGKGYVTMKQAGGNLVKGQVTLNLCGTGYPSERFRTTRLQVNFANQNVPSDLERGRHLPFRRRRAGDARGDPACRHVPAPAGRHRGEGSAEADVPDHAVRGSAPAEGLPRRSRHRDRHDQGKHIDQTSYAVYQRHGNVLSGVYSVGGASRASSQLVLHAAEQSARNLRRGTSGVSSGPTA